MITVGSLFAGIGGFDLGFQNAGFNIQWQVEKDEFCQKVLAKNFPDVQRHGDIFDCHDLPYVDVICGGFPCQPFSLAGNRKGRDDERFLIPEMLRIIKEVQPNAILLENVPGFASLNAGAEFKRLLGALTEIGYVPEWTHIRASDVGAPHRRERWFCVAYRELPNPNCCLPESKKLGNTQRISVKGFRSSGKHLTHTRCQTWASSGAGHRARHAEAETIESRLDRVADGLSYRVDRHQFVAPRNVPQHDFEPSRVTDRKEHRRHRVKALGNAVVPQIIYLIALSMYEVLRE